MSYHRLNVLADNLALLLRSLGVGPEVLVGLCLPRSMAMIVAALGILKAGGAYLPLDPAYPKERLAWMLKDAQPHVLITHERFSESLPEGKWKLLHIDSGGTVAHLRYGAATPSRPFELRPDHLAYVIYTSGSTGMPKGVEVTHGSLLNLVRWHQQAFGLTPGDRATQLASPSFDAAVWEVWPYLTMGARIYLPEDSLRSDPEGLRNWLVAKGITISFVPTPMAERLLSLSWPPETKLRILLTGGDKLHHYPPCTLPFRVINNYGPTEYTVVATSGAVSEADRRSPSPPIGRPIANTQIYILDEELRPLSAGVAGEIYIGGAGLARRYRNQPILTAQRFVSISMGLGGGRWERLYRTGDRARWLPDGQIEYLGRTDEQIKLRGFRIEPNEITTVLDRHPSLQASIVVPRMNVAGEKHLVAYVVLRCGASITANELRELLRAKLPEYMVPSAFVRMESLPETPNGKVDRAALPEPNAANALEMEDDSFEAPQTPTEERVADILATLLGVKRVSRNRNFFHMGGHSLLGAQTIGRLRDAFGVDLPLRELFDAPTVREISAAIEKLILARLEAMSEDEAQRIMASSPESSHDSEAIQCHARAEQGT